MSSTVDKTTLSNVYVLYEIEHEVTKARLIVDGKLSDTIGVAKCNPNDAYVEETGKAIALYRALNQIF